MSVATDKIDLESKGKKMTEKQLKAMMAQILRAKQQEAQKKEGK